MSTDAYNQLIADSLALPSDQRGELAALLLRSLEDGLPESQRRTPDEWRAEVERRSDELHDQLDQGVAESLSAEESLAEAKRRIDELTQR